MKKISIISFIAILTVVVVSCSDVRRSPGRVYMPDMGVSRAYETYADHHNLTDSGIFYNAIPVAGTVKRGEVFPFPLAKDKDGDSTNYAASKQVLNPLPALDSLHTVEAERLYLINCGICHGTKLDGNGPLYKGGDGPYPAAPKNLIGDAIVGNMPAGQIFYSVTYGKGQMGSYASQLSTTQRWMIVHYIKDQQAKAKGGSTATAATSAATTAPAATDTAAKK